MREFYQEIADRKRKGEALTVLEEVVFFEYREKADEAWFHDQKFAEFLAGIACREQDARAHGSGEEDWLVARFHESLKNAGEPAEKPVRKRRTRPDRQHAEIYSLRRQGLSPEQVADRLKISADAVRDADDVLSFWYHQLETGNPHIDRKVQINPRAQTMAALMKCRYRVVYKDEGNRTRYRFYCADKLLGIGSVQHGKDFPLVLQCNGMFLNGRPADGTIVDADDPSLVLARLTWQGDCRELRLNQSSGAVTITIRSEQDALACSIGDRICARIHILPEQRISDWHMQVCMNVSEELPEETAFLLMAVPCMTIG